MAVSFDFLSYMFLVGCMIRLLQNAHIRTIFRYVEVYLYVGHIFVDLIVDK